ncbi:unnamed protein product [Symbiodinium natans]|uniref:Uncharacterized protein n=1 Tax=Symbiodinium natans TaxID=878477 RepID=A0A812M4F1_9DINO|nr:unnamed protein product [Symbiodinium natans]
MAWVRSAWLLVTWVVATCSAGAGSSHAALATIFDPGSLAAEENMENNPEELKLLQARASRGHAQSAPEVKLEQREIASGNVTVPGVVLELVSGNLSMVLEAITIKGGLIQSFSLNNRSILLKRPYVDQMDGCVFWPSPQSAWGWPPPSAIDPTPSKDFDTSYDLRLSELKHSFELVSPVWKDHNMTVSKKVSVDASRMSFIIDYGIHVGGAGGKWAPWEIARVPPSGLTFFKTGSEQNSGSWPPLLLQHIGGVTWFLQKGDASSGKLFASTVPSTPSGLSWLAHTDGVLLFVKCFRHLPDGMHAPGELQIEIYDGVDYVEMEQQGAHEELLPGESITWTVEWFLREMPPGAVATPGDKILMDSVEDMCK